MLNLFNKTIKDIHFLNGLSCFRAGIAFFSVGILFSSGLVHKLASSDVLILCCTSLFAFVLSFMILHHISDVFLRSSHIENKTTKTFNNVNVVPFSASENGDSKFFGNKKTVRINEQDQTLEYNININTSEEIDNYETAKCLEDRKECSCTDEYDADEHRVSLSFVYKPQLNEQEDIVYSDSPKFLKLRQYLNNDLNKEDDTDLYNFYQRYSMGKGYTDAINCYRSFFIEENPLLIEKEMMYEQTQLDDKEKEPDNAVTDNGGQ